MRILTVGSLYPPHHLGGYELVWQAAVRALREAGHEVGVLATTTRFPGVDEAGADPTVRRELRWYWHDHAFPRLGALGRARLERHNHRVLRRHLAGVELVSWWAMGGLSMSLLERVRRAGVPAIGWVNDDWLRYGPEVDQWLRLWPGRPRLGRVAERLVGSPATVDFDRAARWVFCSDATRRSALELHPGLADTKFLHQGVAPVFGPAAPQGWEGRLLYAGRLDERKGIGTLIDAVARCPGVTLRVVGDGDAEEAARLRSRVAAAGAGDRVRFEPGVPRDELARAYAGSDAVVFPVEWSEPWGLVPLEAMATGRPVIATGQGGSAEYLAHERNALVYPPGDADALAAAIARLAGDAGLRERLVAGGHETARRLTEAAWLEAVVAEHEATARAASG